ncbi:MAG: hypothetical protein WB626_04655 [Bacteroidota bacterium]
MKPLLLNAARILLTVLILLGGYALLVRRGKTCNCGADSTAASALPDPEGVLAGGRVLAGLMSINGVGFENGSFHTGGSVSSVLDSLRADWTAADPGIGGSSAPDSLAPVGEPVVEWLKEQDRGFVGVTRVYRSRSGAGSDSMGRAWLGITNSTAIAYREADSSVGVSTARTPGLLDLYALLRAAGGQPLPTPGGDPPVPCTDGWVVLDLRGDGRSSGIWALRLPCPADSVRSFYLRRLAESGWNREAQAEGGVVVLVRRNGGIAALTFSCLEDSGGGGSIALFSYQGSGSPFGDTPLSVP